jgi:hypothetical protein
VCGDLGPDGRFCMQPIESGDPPHPVWVMTGRRGARIPPKTGVVAQRSRCGAGPWRPDMRTWVHQTPRAPALAGPSSRSSAETEASFPLPVVAADCAGSDPAPTESLGESARRPDPAVRPGRPAPVPIGVDFSQRSRWRMVLSNRAAARGYLPPTKAWRTQAIG